MQKKMKYGLLQLLIEKITFQICVVLLFLLLFTVSLFASEQTIAIMNIKPNGVPEKVTRLVTELLSVEIANRNKFVVLERNRLDLILNENKIAEKYCNDTSCAVKVGELLTAHKILIGSLVKVDDNLILLVRIIDVKKKTIEFGEKLKVRSVDELYNKIEHFAKRICERILNNSRKVSKKEDDFQESNYVNPGEYYSPGFAAVSSLIPIWSGSFIPYGFYIQDYPPFGLLLVTGKVLMFMTGITYTLAMKSKQMDADVAIDVDERIQAQKKANDYGSKAKQSFSIMLGLTILDMIYSAISVSRYNKREFPSYQSKKTGKINYIITPRVTALFRDYKTDGINLKAELIF